VAKFALTLLATLRGSISLYQGEELGLTEAELRFEDLRDPYGIRFWPGFKGRDGCRTPMVWEELAVYAGFSRVKPWLPIPEEHRRRSVSVEDYDPNSVLAHYRRTIEWRRKHAPLVSGGIRFLPSGEDILAFLRDEEGETILCVFNFARENRDFVFDRVGAVSFIEAPGFPAPRLSGKRIILEGLGAAFGIVG
jgi:alpha-glucosidase